MNPFEKIPEADDDEVSAEDIKKVSENLDNEISEEEVILLDKIATAEEQIREEWGVHFLKLSSEEAARLIEERIEENDKKLAKEIDELSS